MEGLSPSTKLIIRETTLHEAKRIVDDDVQMTGHVCDSAYTRLKSLRWMNDSAIGFF